MELEKQTSNDFSDVFNSKTSAKDANAEQSKNTNKSEVLNKKNPPFYTKKWFFISLPFVVFFLGFIVIVMSISPTDSQPSQQIQVAAPELAAPQPDITPAPQQDDQLKQLITNQITQQKQNAAVVAAINTLNSQIQYLNGQINALKSQEGQLATMSSQPPVVLGTKQVNGYSLNSIYPNQAWLKKGDKTYVVSQGDKLGNITINKIDATRREVTTSAGLIR